MINESLTFIVNQVNEYIGLKANGDTTRVELNALVDQQGNVMVQDDRVACTLVSIEEERIAKSQVSYEIVNGVTTRKNPLLKFNLYLLFAANPKVDTVSTNYSEGLKLISHIITFFQGKNVFDKYNSTDFPEGTEKLIMEIYSLPIEQQNYLWGAIGAKYMPSVLYRMRLVVMDDKKSKDIGPGITSVQTTINESFND